MNSFIFDSNCKDCKIGEFLKIKKLMEKILTSDIVCIIIKFLSDITLFETSHSILHSDIYTCSDKKNKFLYDLNHFKNFHQFEGNFNDLKIINIDSICLIKKQGRDRSFYSKIKFINKKKNTILTINLNYCDYEYFNPFEINNFLNEIIKYYKLIIRENSKICNKGESYKTSIIVDGLIQFPNME